MTMRGYGLSHGDKKFRHSSEHGISGFWANWGGNIFDMVYHEKAETDACMLW